MKINFRTKKTNMEKKILHMVVLLNLGQKFGEEPHMGVMVKCPYTFDHTV